MLAIRDPSSLSRLPDSPESRLIEQRIEEYGSDAGLATIVAVEPGDPPDALGAQLGLPIPSNCLDGRRHGEPGCAPSFDTFEERPTCYETVFVLADYGDGALVAALARRAAAEPT